MEKYRIYIEILIVSILFFIVAVPVWGKGISDNNTLSENNEITISGEDTSVSFDRSFEIDASGHSVDQVEKNTTLYVVSQNKLYLVLSAVSVDELSAISNNIISINEVLNDQAEDIRNLKLFISRNSTRDAEYQEKVETYLHSLNESVSMAQVGVSDDRIVSFNNIISVNGLSADSVSLDAISGDSVSSGDIDHLTDAGCSYLKPIFYAIVACAVGIWCLLAVQVERLVFGRMH